MSNKLLTIPEYATKIDKHRSCVFKAAQKENLTLLPGVIKIHKVGKLRLLEVTR